MEEKCPRVLIAGTASGCGKTTLTCALLSALQQKNIPLTALKCGPDYIDPMFHRSVLGITSGNLDSFFCDTPTLRWQMAEQSQGITVLEGVMGFFDGQQISSLAGSSYDLSQKLEIPTILVVNGKGTAHSVLPVIQGFLSYQERHFVGGVILNHLSATTYQQIKPLIQEHFKGKIKVLGYFPKLSADLILESRHLGLVTPDKLVNIREKMQKLGEIAQETLELEEIIQFAYSAPLLSYPSPQFTTYPPVTIGVAKDQAFSFYYEENLRFLEKMGAKLVYFSPLLDENLPSDLDGLYIGGGYPELHLKQLEANQKMREDILRFLQEKRPCIAECGGFMYLNKEIEGRQMVGFLPGTSTKQAKLQRFGYITLTSEKKSLLTTQNTPIKGHEFHYYACDPWGEDFQAKKPNGTQWVTGTTTPEFYGGFPHLSFLANPQIPENFIKKCLEK